MNYQRVESPGATIEDYKWWRDARFGIFIHWNTSSVLNLLSGSWHRIRSKMPKGQIMGSNAMSIDVPPQIRDGEYLKYMEAAPDTVPHEIYDNLHHAFNPKSFNPKAWAQLLVEAGAGYVVFTAKHHDGFCMFETSHTDYNIMNTPYGRDIAREFADAMREAGLPVMWYYSVADWFHPDYDETNIERYGSYLHQQTKELLSNYGPIAGVWWDGGSTVLPQKDEIFRDIHQLQPGALSNGRFAQAPPITFTTPEQRLGAFDMDRPWETCAVAGGGWFWDGGHVFKSTRMCMQMLINCAGGDGNLLLDIAPDRDGRIARGYAGMLLRMGKWLEQYGESIYGTRGGPYKPGLWGVSTRKGKKIYLHITQKWASGALVLPPLPCSVKRCTTLTGGTPEISQSTLGLRVELPPGLHHEMDTIVVLELDRDAIDLDSIETMERRTSVTVGARVTASSQSSETSKGNAETVVLGLGESDAVATHFGEEPGNTPPLESTKRWDLNRRHCWRYWEVAKGDWEPWIDVDLGKDVMIDRVCLEERLSRIQEFELLRNIDNEWFILDSGTELANYSLHLQPPIRASRIRLVITKYSTEGAPGLSVFDIYGRCVD